MTAILLMLTLHKPPQWPPATPCSNPVKCERTLRPVTGRNGYLGYTGGRK